MAIIVFGRVWNKVYIEILKRNKFIDFLQKTLIIFEEVTINIQVMLNAEYIKESCVQKKI